MQTERPNCASRRSQRRTVHVRGGSTVRPDPCYTLKLAEFGDRPTFYAHSRFQSDNKASMGDRDLRAVTDEVWPMPSDASKPDQMSMRRAAIFSSSIWTAMRRLQKGSIERLIQMAKALSSTVAMGLSRSAARKFRLWACVFSQKQRKSSGYLRLNFR